jgi:hypothetical protein
VFSHDYEISYNSVITLRVYFSTARRNLCRRHVWRTRCCKCYREYLVFHRLGNKTRRWYKAIPKVINVLHDAESSEKISSQTNPRHQLNEDENFSIPSRQVNAGKCCQRKYRTKKGTQKRNKYGNTIKSLCFNFLRLYSCSIMIRQAPNNKQQNTSI